MANKTIALTSELYSGTVGMKLYLLNPTSGAIGNNASGDTLTEGVNGLFSTVVDEAITGWWRVLVTDASDGPLIEGGWVYIPSDVVGTYVVDDPSLMSTISANVTTLLGRITADVYTMFTNLIAMITGTGANASFTSKAMENARSSVAVYPTQLQAEDRNVEGPIKVYTGESGQQFFHAIDANQDPINLTGITLELRFGDSLTKNTLYTAKTSDGTIVVSNQNKVTFTKNVAFTRFEMSTLKFSLRNMDAGGEVILTGPVKLSWAP